MRLVHSSWHPGDVDEPVPTVFAFHGHGAHAGDLLGLGPYLASGRVQLICPEGEFVLLPGMLGFTWFDRDEEGNRAAGELDRVAALVRAFIDEAGERYRVDPDRTILLGFSQGGEVAYRVGLAEPRRFAGLAALSARLSDDAMAAADRNHAAELPVMVQHGTEDGMVPIERGREARERLRSLGVTPDYHEYPVQHQIGIEGVHDLSAWIERVLGLPPMPSSAPPIPEDA